MDIADRIKILLDSIGCSQKQLADAIDRDPRTVSQWMKKKAELSLDAVQRVAVATQCRKDWLRYGTGSIFPNNGPAPKELITIERKSRRSIDVTADVSPLITQLSLPGFNIRQVPVLNVVQCGNWKHTTDMDYPAGISDRREPAPTNDPNAFIIIARGDSMVGDDIRDGDMLLVEPNRPIYTGNIVLVVGMDLGCTVKRYKATTEVLGSIILEPSNPNHNPIVLTKEEMEKERIRIYRIIKVMRDV